MLRLSGLALVAVTLAACGDSDGAGGEAVAMDAQELARACATAVSAETGTPASGIRATALRPQSDMATVTLAVDNAAAPWICEISSAGVVRRVYYGADE